MPLSLQHRHAVLLADRTRDISTINIVVTEVLAANPETSLLDIETALRARRGRLPAKRTWWPTAPQPVTRLCSVRRAGRPRSLMPASRSNKTGWRWQGAR